MSNVTFGTIDEGGGLSAEIARLRAEVERLHAWVDDLHSGMYVNCVYCGHRYGPGETTPVSMADALKAHVEQCPEHPMSALRASEQRARELLALVLPLALGYAAAHPVGKNQDYCGMARAYLSPCDASPGDSSPTGKGE